jgi:hypothetical protein
MGLTSLDGNKEGRGVEREEGKKERERERERERTKDGLR